MQYPVGVKPGALVPVIIPSIYKNYSVNLPERMAWLQPHAAAALMELNQKLEEIGGKLYLSDCYRSSEDQAKAYIDYLSSCCGNQSIIGHIISKFPSLRKYQPKPKRAFSTPPGESFHEAGLAIDVDVSFKYMKVDQRKFAEIAWDCGWRDIVHKNFGNPKLVDVREEWHWECLGKKWEEFSAAQSKASPMTAYKNTARAAILDIREEEEP